MSNPKNILAILSQFSGYGIEGHSPEIEKGMVLTTDQIYNLLRSVSLALKQDHIQKLAHKLETHINTTDGNPHRLDWSHLYTNVIDELYKVWLNLGNTGSKDKFIGILFQYIEIASSEEVKQGVPNKLVSAKDAKLIFDEHNENPDAHAPLMEALFGGEPVYTPPCLVIEPLNDDLTPSIDEIREGDISYIDRMGFVKIAGPNEPVVDYSFGVAAYTTWEQRINRVLHSEDLNLGNKTLIGPAYVSSDNIQFIDGTTGPRPVVLNQGVVDNDQSGIRIPNQTVMGEQAITFSAFLKRRDTERVAVVANIFNAASELIDTAIMVVDLVSGLIVSTSYVNHAEGVLADCSTLKIANGWIRASLAVKGNTGTHSVTFCINFIDIDNNLIFSGTDTASVYATGFQVEYGAGASPYKRTENTHVSSAASTKFVEIDNEKLAKTEGMIGVIGAPASFIEPLKWQTMIELRHTDIMLSPEATILRLSFINPGTGAGNATAQVLSKSLALVGSHHFKSNNRRVQGYAIGYGHSDGAYLAFHDSGGMVTTKSYENNDVHDEPDILYIGCEGQNRQLNGYVKSVIAYPNHGTTGNLRFLTAGGEETSVRYQYRHFNE